MDLFRNQIINTIALALLCHERIKAAKEIVDDVSRESKEKIGQESSKTDNVETTKLGISARTTTRSERDKENQCLQVGWVFFWP